MIIVLTTVPDEKSASALARQMVERKLAACVSIAKLERSIYRWKGKVEDEPEFLLLIKTMDKAYGKVEAFIKANHPHSVPEIVCIKADKAESNYHEWVKRSTLPFAL